jgi:hypothetical protein
MVSQNVKDLINIEYCKSDDVKICYMDRKKLSNNIIPEVSTQIYSKEFLLDKDLNDNLYEKVTLKIKETAFLNKFDDLDIKEIINDDYKLSSTILLASQHIRIGSFNMNSYANTLLHNNRELFDIQLKGIQIEDIDFMYNPHLTHEDVIVYRKCKPVETGLSLIINEKTNKYNFVEKGFSYEKNFVYFKILDKIKDRRRKLKNLK